VEKIQKTSNSIRSLAQDSKQNFEKINEAAAANPPRLSEITERSNQGISEQAEIIEKTEGIIEATSGVVDTVPWWANTVEIVMIAAIVLGIIGLLWYSGLGTLLHGLIGRAFRRRKDA
jgi:methyl-accepting chemotaxis protein